MPHTYTSPKVTPTLDIKPGSLWRDNVDDITVRVIIKTINGVTVRCISGATGKVWIDCLPYESFTTELTLVN